MSHVIREQPNGEWCIYSTMVEDFIIINASREELIEYKLEKERERLEGVLDEVEENGCQMPRTNMTMEFDDCINNSKWVLDEYGSLVEN